MRVIDDLEGDNKASGDMTDGQKTVYNRIYAGLQDNNNGFISTLKKINLWKLKQETKNVNGILLNIRKKTCKFDQSSKYCFML